MLGQAALLNRIDFMIKLFSPLAIGLLLVVNGHAQDRTIQVAAQSTIRVMPDEVVLDFRLETRKTELLEAKKANDELAENIFQIARKHGIPSTDVAVFDMDLSPVFERGESRQEEKNRGVKAPIAFRYLRSMRVRLTDFTAIEPFLVDCYKVGLEDLSGLSFGLSNQREHQFKARELAIVYCLEKAKHLTELTGMKLGSPVKIEEDVERNWGTNGLGGGGVFGASNENETPGTIFVSVNGPEELPDLDLVAPGLIEINAKVMVVYEMTKDE